MTEADVPPAYEILTTVRSIGLNPIGQPVRNGPYYDTPPRARTPRWQLRSDDAPPAPPDQRRAILSAPPPAAEGPTPIRPTPRFNSKADPTGKFGEPRDARSNAPSPPPGYSPPSALPPAD